MTWDASDRGRRPRNGDQGNVLGRDRGGAGRQEHPDPVRPRAGPGPDRRCPRCWRPRRSTITSSARACGCRPGSCRNRRGARSPSLLRAGGLWRGGDQSLRRVRDARADPRREGAAAESTRERREELHQGGRQGHPARSCPRWASRPTSPIAARRSSTRSACRPPFVDKYFTGTATSIEGVGLAKWPRKRSAATPRPMATIRSCTSMLDVGGIYQYRMRGEDTRLDPGQRRPAAARGARQRAGPIRGLRQGNQRAVRTAAADHPRADGARTRPTRTDLHRRGRTRGRDRQALQHRGDELWLDLAGSAHYPGDRDEPHRRPRTPERAARSRTASCRCPTAIRCVRRSSRSPAGASA